ncbi:DedA family protein [Maricaulis parjimensis]|uniref:DedA family protein n=1 Tax=Maricaulis parjimensis TaxID=144023 RepID=UPI00193A1F26|nr:VTT domain-containing protein [Maricaulis parjimensis]
MTGVLESAPDSLVLLVLFAGAFLDALPGPCLFVFGEVFFVLAGNLVQETGSLWPVLAVFAGAFLADQAGYWGGRRAATPLKKLVLARSGRRKAYRRARAGLTARLVLFVAISRLLGPVAWITPALAGSLSASWSRFTLGSFLGVLIGVGQFVVYGWMLAAGIDLAGGDLGAFVEQHALALIVFANLLGMLAIFVWRWISVRRHTPR